MHYCRYIKKRAKRTVQLRTLAIVSVIWLCCLMIDFSKLQVNDSFDKLSNSRQATERGHHSDELISFEESLTYYASPSMAVILPCVVDWGYLDMAVNYYEYNIKRLNITNALFVCVDKRACDVLRERRIPAHFLSQDGDGNASHEYYSEAFRRKAATKLDIALRALLHGVHVLISDVDVIFFRNPLEKLELSSCDLQIQVDKGHVMNSGFFFARSTAASIELFQLASNLMKQTPNYDQEVINDAIRILQRRRREAICIRRLSTLEYPSAIYYFERAHRHYVDDGANPCRQCVAMHNNWLVGVPAKIYRLKEHLMWRYDKDGYYTDTTRTYMSYDNSFVSQSSRDSMAMQHRALANALSIALITNRTLILPRFYCNLRSSTSSRATATLCPLYLLHNVKNFDREFGGQYRESSFTRNPMTNQQLKSHKPTKVLILTNTSHCNVFVPGVAQHTAVEDVNYVLRTASRDCRVSDKEIAAWHTTNVRQSRLLHFISLQNANIVFENQPLAKQLQFSRGLTPASEKPYNVDGIS